MEELLSQFAQLIEDLQGMAPHVWEVLVRQSAVEGVKSAVWTMVWIALVMLCIRGGRWLWNEGDDGNGAEVAWMCAFWVLAALCLLAMVVKACDTASYFMNPEFYALQLLIRSVK